MKKVIPLLLLAMTIAASCRPAAPVAAPTAVATWTLQPTYTPYPTYTPPPIATPHPTATETVESTVTPAPTSTSTPRPTATSDPRQAFIAYVRHIDKWRDEHWRPWSDSLEQDLKSDRLCVDRAIRAEAGREVANGWQRLARDAPDLRIREAHLRLGYVLKDFVDFLEDGMKGYCGEGSFLEYQVVPEKLREIVQTNKEAWKELVLAVDMRRIELGLEK